MLMTPDSDWEDDEINDIDHEYITDIVPFVARFKQEMLKQLPESSCYFLGPQHYQELTLPSFEVCRDLLNPSGSSITARYLVRVTLASENKYYLIKQIPSIEKGKIEIKIGALIQQIGKDITPLHTYNSPTIFGFKEQIFNYPSSTFYFVALPWLLSTPLDSFIQNGKLKDLSLCTQDLIRMTAPLSLVLISLWNHHKVVLRVEKVFIEASDKDHIPELILVDYTLEGSYYQSFIHCFCEFLENLHSAITIDSPNKNETLVKEWIQHKNCLREQKISIIQFHAWLYHVSR